jgi:hypothetical protein
MRRLGALIAGFALATLATTLGGNAAGPAASAITFRDVLNSPAFALLTTMAHSERNSCRKRSALASLSSITTTMAGPTFFWSMGWTGRVISKSTPLPSFITTITMEHSLT